MPELSIIVPVYKVEKYLKKCIDSILAQTFTDFELILIDDGSPDRCGVICDEYASADSRIKVIHQKNGGVSSARNAGLDIATGTYLGFVDSDDWIDPDMYETMIAAANEKNVDVVICAAKHVDENDTFICTEMIADLYYYNIELLNSLYGTPSNVGGACWNKVLRRSKIADERFDNDVKMAEDWLYLLRCFIKMDSALQIPNTFYSVVDRKFSATRTNVVDSMYDLVFGGKLSISLSIARKHSVELEKLAMDKSLDDCLRYSNMLREAGMETNQKWRWKFIKIRLQMLKLIPGAYFKKLLPKEKIHGYIYEMVKL